MHSSKVALSALAVLLAAGCLLRQSNVPVNQLSGDRDSAADPGGAGGENDGPASDPGGDHVVDGDSSDTGDGADAVPRCPAGSQDHDQDGVCMPACADPATSGVSCPFQACDDSTGVATCLGCVVFVDVAQTTQTSTGESWDKAFVAIEPGLAAAAARLDSDNPWCDVWVRRGTYYIFATAPTDTVSLRANVRLAGGFAGGETALAQRDIAAQPTILSGEKLGTTTERVIHVVTATSHTTLDGFIVTRGLAHGYGGSGDDREYGGGFVARDCGNVVIRNCLFFANEAGWAGGLYLSGVENLLFADSWVTGNTVGGNGGGMIVSGVSGLFSNVVFAANQSGYGGGAAYYQGSNELSFERCAFVANHAGASGGAFAFNGYVRPRLSACLFAANEADNNGGAIFGDGTTTGTRPTLVSSAFIGNATPNGNGGAIYNDAQTLTTIRNCTFAHNESSQWGGAIANEGDGGYVDLYNTVMWQNFGYAQVNHALSLTGTGVDTHVILHRSLASDQAGWCQGNCGRDDGTLATDPGFSSITGAVAGTWASVAIDSQRRTSTLVANGAPGWTIGALVHKFVRPDTAKRHQYPIVANTANTLVVLGDVTGPNTAVQAGDAFELFDYTPGSASPCVDAGVHYHDILIDAAGQPRPVCLTGWDPGCFDLGAYERQ